MPVPDMSNMLSGHPAKGPNPPMPWVDIGTQSDADLKAIFAYLKSIPKVDNRVPDHKVPVPAINGITTSFEKLKAMMAAPPSKYRLAHNRALPRAPRARAR